MRKSTLRILFACTVLSGFFVSSCKDDSFLQQAPVDTKNYSYTEEFDTASAALSRGWRFYNRSEPLGSSVWQDGGSIPAFFNAYSNNGSNIGFIGADYLSTSAEMGTISNWLVSPLTYFQNGDKISFYARGQNGPGYTATDSTDFGNRLQLRLNITNDLSDNMGTGLEVGYFDKGLLDINPNYYEWHNAPGTYAGTVATLQTISQAFPSEWTRFEATVTGLAKPTWGRFAFRYLVEDGGSNGRGSGVGIDQVTFKSASSH